MEPDLSRLQSTTQQPGFRNTNEFSGDFQITGNAGGVANIITHTVDIGFVPILAEIVFQGPSDEDFEGFYGDVDERPTAAWFKRGRVWTEGNDAGAGYTDYPTDWLLSAKLTGSILTVEASFFKTFTANLALTPITVYYKVIDYSVF